MQKLDEGEKRCLWRRFSSSTKATSTEKGDIPYWKLYKSVKMTCLGIKTLSPLILWDSEEVLITIQMNIKILIFPYGI